MPKVSTSILSADFSVIKDEVLKLEMAEADYIHVDVMDGMFVDNITVGPKFVCDLKSCAQIPLDVHLMIEKPERYVKRFLDAGSNILTVHIEAASDIKKVLSQIRSSGALAGIAISPNTAAMSLDGLYEYADLILIMTVHPGFAGQAFLQNQLEKIQYIKRKIALHSSRCTISVDGGINAETAKLCLEAGADVLVAGSYVFAGEYSNRIRALKVGL